MASSQKLFDAALRRAVAQSDGKLLRDAAESLLLSAASGLPWAIQMLADRLDGKPAQSVSLTAEIKQKAAELSDDELAAIAAGRSTGVAEPTRSAGKSGPVH